MQVSLYNKMEKADILDMAVRYIKAIRTHPEISTTTCRQARENSTTGTRNYEIPSPSPLQARTTCHLPREIVSNSTLTKNCPRVGNDDDIKVETSCVYDNLKANEQIINSEKENSLTARNGQNSINQEISRRNTVTNATIWRPW